MGFTDLPAINSPTMNGDGWTPFMESYSGDGKNCIGLIRISHVLEVVGSWIQATSMLHCMVCVPLFIWFWYFDMRLEVAAF